MRPTNFLDSPRSVVAMSAIALGLVSSSSVLAADFQQTSISALYGSDREAVFGGGEFATDVVTIEHFSSTSYGNNFFFFDTENFTGDTTDIAGGGSEVYGEYTVAFSYNKLTDGDISIGPLNDISLAFQANVGGGAGSRVGLVGPQLSFDIPGFNLFNVQAFWRNDFDAPDHTYQITVSYNSDFSISGNRFVLEGYADWVVEGNGSTVLGDDHRANANSQPRFLLDIGNYWGEPNKLLVGTEVYLWNNKYGSDRDEFSPHFFAKWVF